MQFEGHDRSHAGLVDGVRDALELRFIESGRFFQKDVFACPRRRDRLVGMQMIGSGDRDDVDLGIRQQVGKPRGEPGIGKRQPVGGETFARARFITSAQRHNPAARVFCKRGQVLTCDPADSDETNSERAHGGKCIAPFKTPSRYFRRASALALDQSFWVRVTRAGEN